jgi:hypothetical protein
LRLARAPRMGVQPEGREGAGAAQEGRLHGVRRGGGAARSGARAARSGRHAGAGERVPWEQEEHVPWDLSGEHTSSPKLG